MTETRKKAKARSLRDLLDAPFPLREHMVFPWLRQGESAMIWAATGVGKTMLTMTVALMVAGGGRALGWESYKPRKVLIVDGEMAREDLQDRARMLMETVEGIDKEAAADNLAIMARTWQTPGAEFPELNGTDGQDDVLRAAKRHGADLVVLDNFSTLADVKDENDAAAMGPTLTFLMRLKAERIGCILVHHSGKTGSTFRGSSRLEATFEVTLGLRRQDGAEIAAGAAFTTEWTKYRGEPHPSMRPRDVRLVNGGAAGPQWSVEAAEGDKARDVVKAVESCLYRTQREAAAALEISPGEFSKRLRQAKRDGLTSAAEVGECFAQAAESAEGDDQDF